MDKQIGTGEMLTFLPAEEQRYSFWRKWPHKRFWPYRWGLAASEILMVFVSLLFCGRIFGVAFIQAGDFPVAVILPVFCLLLLSFSPSYQLYSYHLIFSRKKHRAAFLKVFGWGLMVLLVILSQHLLPMLGVAFPVTTLALLCAGGIGLFYMGYRFNQALPLLFRALGISLIVFWLFNRIYHEQPAMMHELALALPLVWLFSAALVWASRSFIVDTVYNRWLRRRHRRQVGIIGSNEDAKEIASHIIDHNAPFWVAGTIGRHCRLESKVPKDCLGDIVELPAIAKQNRLSDFIVTDESLDRRTLISLLDFCLAKGITVWFTPKLLPIIDRKIYINHFCGMPMIRMCSLKRATWFNRVKYGLDALITLPACLLLAPLFGLIALAIKVDSKGPVFYRARAIGKNGQEFGMFKFRSMHVNNDASIHREFVTKLIKGEIGTDKDEKKPLKITNDPRVTRMGRILRKCSLDELPQLINVLMGQMSLIGPRPCLPYEFDVYQDWYKKRAAIRPGITGLWQVAGRSEVAFEEMILLDLYYLYNRSLWMDINLLVETVFVVFSKKGAY
jgi:exopolysaccharide biosynthesis polyprenyl glycosylphosphotransferase